MKLSELTSREIIDLATGTRMGLLSQADLEFDENTGKLSAICIETNKRVFRAGQPIRILWDTVQVVGKDSILVRL